MQLKSLGILLGLTIVIGCKKDPPAPLPTANFYVENNGCTSPCALYFYDDSQNAVKWNWNFGNGVTSSNQNDSITFGVSGTYETWLEIWNADDIKDSIRKTIHIN